MPHASRSSAPTRASHGSVLDDLGLRIADGVLAPGTVLTLAGLEEEYGVSRTVIREAVRVLEAKGMIESRRRIGVTITPMSRWSVLDPVLIRWRLSGSTRPQQIVALTELRLAIEPVAARLAAQRASELERAEIGRLAGLLKQLGDAGKGDSEEYLSADIAFHDRILEAGGNLMLTAIKQPIAEVITGRHNAGLTPAHPLHGALHNHVEAATAIVRGDADGAERHVRGYVETILAEVRAEQ
ncbi:FadR/GntR family transcriptional regulator [Sediminivirga luteola]|uniref:GntR family transcriptional regulator n=1 Tax=Sediminivirga luteola TaxID=1774748 RepID=A0A8J2U0W6_9MICO|nr:FCD domain-containing protein [Sediminivirga luteola]MCI2264905.1 FCD domain-containing protein [Sediminivirga luteola]GGA26355.1 GntR family transcriptional regulator [Sediminivirga luteola]